MVLSPTAHSFALNAQGNGAYYSALARAALSDGKLERSVKFQEIAAIHYDAARIWLRATGHD